MHNDEPSRAHPRNCADCKHINAVSPTCQCCPTITWLQARKRYLATLRAAVLIQAAFRGHKARQYVQNIREHRAALLIQSWWRSHVARTAYLRVLRGVIAAQVRPPLSR